MYSVSIAGKSDPNWGDDPLATSAAVPSLSPASLEWFDSQKRRDWNTFLQYLRKREPPITLGRCNEYHVLDFLRYWDQFEKTKVKVHLTGCPYYGNPEPPGPCTCPLRHAWGSFEALIGRLGSAYEEHGGPQESNPFRARAVRDYLREVSERQANTRGISYTGTGGDGSGSAAQTTTTTTTTSNAIEEAIESNQVKLANEEHEKDMCRAAGSGSAVADEAYKYAKEFLNNQADYNLEYNYESLIEQATKLNACRDDMLAQAKTKQVTPVREAWISKVKKYEEEVRELETRYKKEKSNRWSWSQFLHGSSESRKDLSQSMAEKCKNMHNLGVEVKSEIGIVVDKLPERVIIMHGGKRLRRLNPHDFYFNWTRT